MTPERALGQRNGEKDDEHADHDEPGVDRAVRGDLRAHTGSLGGFALVLRGGLAHVWTAMEMMSASVRSGVPFGSSMPLESTRR